MMLKPPAFPDMWFSSFLVIIGEIKAVSSTQHNKRRDERVKEYLCLDAHIIVGKDKEQREFPSLPQPPNNPTP